MIDNDRYPVEPWQLREIGVDPDMLGQSESLFALSNGHIGSGGTWTRAIRPNFPAPT